LLIFVDFKTAVELVELVDTTVDIRCVLTDITKFIQSIGL